MKKIYKLLAVLLAIVTFSSCETYGDYDVEYSPIYPLSGEWIVNIYDANGYCQMPGGILAIPIIRRIM